jgi:hypothetical protein
MAGTLKILAVDTDVRTLFSVALGLTSNVKGVHFDGYYFWVVDTARIYQVLVEGANAFICRVVDISSTLPGTSPEITGLCGNEHYLWIAYKHTTNSYEVAQYTLDGNRVFLLPGFTRSSAAGTEWFDLCMIGEHYIFSERDAGPAASDEETIMCEITTGLQVRTTTNRNRMIGMDVDGYNLWKIGNDGKLLVQDFQKYGTLFAPAAIISTATEGLKIMNRDCDGRRDFGHKFYSGEGHLLALVHN